MTPHLRLCWLGPRPYGRFDRLCSCSCRRTSRLPFVTCFSSDGEIYARTCADPHPSDVLHASLLGLRRLWMQRDPCCCACGSLTMRFVRRLGNSGARHCACLLLGGSSVLRAMHLLRHHFCGAALLLARRPGLRVAPFGCTPCGPGGDPCGRRTNATSNRLGTRGVRGSVACASDRLCASVPCAYSLASTTR